MWVNKYKPVDDRYRSIYNYIYDVDTWKSCINGTAGETSLKCVIMTAPSWPDSSTGRALHWHHRGQALNLTQA